MQTGIILIACCCSGGLCLCLAVVALLVFVPEVRFWENDDGDTGVTPKPPSPKACPAKSHVATHPFQKQFSGTTWQNTRAECCKFKDMKNCIRLKKTSQNTWALDAPRSTPKPTSSPSNASPSNASSVTNQLPQPQCAENMDIRVVDTLMGFDDGRCFDFQGRDTWQSVKLENQLVQDCYLKNYKCESLSRATIKKREEEKQRCAPFNMKKHDDNMCWEHLPDGTIQSRTECLTSCLY